MEPEIIVNHLSKTFITKTRTINAAQDISFTVGKGEIFGIIGLSGAGKSTLVRCLNLLEKPDAGEIIINGKNLVKLSPNELRLARRDIGMIFQSFNLLMQRNVLDNVCFPFEIAGLKRAEAKDKAMELLKTVGLEEKALSYPAQLSGGQKQRVAIARVLASDPKVLLCDEATSALDPETTKSILDLLKEINRKYGITIVMITHEMAVVQEICDRVLVLEKGKLMEEGLVKEIFHSPKTEAAKRLLINAGTEIQRITKGRIVRVTFSESSAYEPVIGNVTLQFRTPVNILFADIKKINDMSVGQMILQLPDDEKTAAEMVEYFKSKNLTVEDWNENV